MLTSTLKGRTAKAAAGLAAAALVAGSALVGGAPAGADPRQAAALVGVGSDTTQDVMNALAGEANGNLYTPIRSSSASGFRQIASWDAIGSACVTPKAPGATMDRPNGSTGGRKALSRALDGANYGSACGIKPISGLVDFARSSSGPGAGNPDLTYVPFGRDGVSFAYYSAGGVGSPVTTLTRAQLTTLFTGSASAPTVIGGVNVYPCGIQTLSGTYGFWNTVTTASAGQEDTATTLCRNATSTSFGNGRVEENDGVALKAKGDALAASTSGPVEVVIGFSAAKFISMSNNVSLSTLAGTGVLLGSISDNGSGTNLGSPTSGSAPTLTPNATFYNDTVFGRNVYNVFDTAKVTGFGNNDIKTLFVGATSAICSAAAQTTVNTFGFLSTASCGSTTTTGPFIAGTF